VQFVATKCWLKSYDSNKVIVEVIQKGRLYELAKVVQLLVTKRSTKIKKSDL
jgi:hypothetical protein